MTLHTYQNRMDLQFNPKRIQKLTQEQIVELRKAKKLQEDDDYNRKDNMKLKK